MLFRSPPVAVVDKVVDRKKTRDVAEAYLRFLYTPAAQEIEAQNHYRPRNKDIADKHASAFTSVEIFNISEFGGWAKASAHFREGGTFDQIYTPGK